MSNKSVILKVVKLREIKERLEQINMEIRIDSLSYKTRTMLQAEEKRLNNKLLKDYGINNIYRS